MGSDKCSRRYDIRFPYDLPQYGFPSCPSSSSSLLSPKANLNPALKMGREISSRSRFRVSPGAWACTHWTVIRPASLTSPASRKICSLQFWMRSSSSSSSCQWRNHSFSYSHFRTLSETGHRQRSNCHKAKTNSGSFA